MLFTAEVRWFLPGRLPGPLTEQFMSAQLSVGLAHHEQLVRTEAPRIDTYLLMPGATAVGVKYREGMFEIKARTSDPVTRDVGSSWRGTFATWCKLSVRSDRFELGDLWPEDLSYRRYIRKQRVLRKYVRDGGIASCPVDRLPDAGCNLELAEVQRVDSDVASNAHGLSEPFWSLAFEAWSASAQIHLLAGEFVAPLIERFEFARFGIDLTEASSLSYPDWLDRYAQPA